MITNENLAQATHIADILGVTLPQLNKCTGICMQVLQATKSDTDAVLFIYATDLPEKLKLWAACKVAQTRAFLISESLL